jgi:L-alanine-DL-glutamate epimerase-like enolase superfamily enzyme
MTLFVPEDTENAVLPIEDIETITFAATSEVTADDEGHVHPAEEAHEVEKRLFRVSTENGHEGYCFGGVGDAESLLRDILVGRDGLNRERIWQKLSRSQRINNTTLTEPVLATVDQALWDLAGRYTGLPVCKLVGANRETVPAYASTMIGDEDRGLSTPAEYADFAEDCLERGYPAYKLHTLFPPYAQDWERDAETCRAVAERVGDEMDLMLDCSAHYSRMEALELGRAIEDLGFYWYEEMMHEQSMSAYQWLHDRLDVPLCGPETQKGWGKMGVRAEWIKHDAVDICRTGIYDVGGITPVLKTVGLCESFGVPLELHGGGAGHLQILGAMGIPGEYYERGLLHPEVEYDPQPPWLDAPIDPMDGEGRVQIPQRPGLGYDVDWDYVDDHRVDATDGLD